jgi:hypothetical protein
MVPRLRGHCLAIVAIAFIGRCQDAHQQRTRCRFGGAHSSRRGHRLMSGCSSGGITCSAWRSHFRVALPRDISYHPRGLPERWPVRSLDDQPDPGDVAGVAFLLGSAAAVRGTSCRRGTSDVAAGAQLIAQCKQHCQFAFAFGRACSWHGIVRLEVLGPRSRDRAYMYTGVQPRSIASGMSAAAQSAPRVTNVVWRAQDGSIHACDRAVYLLLGPQGEQAAGPSEHSSGT